MCSIEEPDCTVIFADMATADIDRIIELLELVIGDITKRENLLALFTILGVIGATVFAGGINIPWVGALLGGGMKFTEWITKINIKKMLKALNHLLVKMYYIRDVLNNDEFKIPPGFFNVRITIYSDRIEFYFPNQAEDWNITFDLSGQGP
ncbi:MAG: hypothetical protein OEZ02_09500 [Anaerolineae bacterium]|nr:hypothetical protein [Anaerolineae bacterium]